MDRRDFIRLLGSGTVAAAVTGCTAELPSIVVAAWQGPPADLGDRLCALSHAILAPGSHNRQLWLVDTREADAITLYVDRERLLPETDPWFRQIMVSQGSDPEQRVDDALLAQVANGSWSGQPANIAAGFTTASDQVGQLRQLAFDAARVEVGTARTVMESNRLTRIGPTEKQARTP